MNRTTADDATERTKKQLAEVLASVLKQQTARCMPPIYMRWLLASTFFGMAGAYPAEMDLMARFAFFCLTGFSCLIALHLVPKGSGRASV